jgi:hypothetical protein
VDCGCDPVAGSCGLAMFLRVPRKHARTELQSLSERSLFKEYVRQFNSLIPSVAAAKVRESGQVMWDLRWAKWHCGRFSPTGLVSPANSHSTDCSTFIAYHLGLVQKGE